MKIVHKNLQRQINFEEHQFWSLVIENPKEFYRLSNDLYKQSIGEEGEFVVSHNNESINAENKIKTLTLRGFLISN